MKYLAQLFLLQSFSAGGRRDDPDLQLKLLPPTGARIAGRISGGVDKSWEGWQKRTGELPRDFASMPSQPFLPDPPAGVKTLAGIRSQFQNGLP